MTPSEAQELGRTTVSLYFKVKRMITKIVTPTLKDYFSYVFRRADPQDIWEFEAVGLRGKVVNGWRSGMTLIINDIVVDQSDRLLSLDGTRPLLSASECDHLGNLRKTEVFVQALTSVRIKILVDGASLSEQFV